MNSKIHEKYYSKTSKFLCRQSYGFSSLVKAMVFLVAMQRCESSTMKKTEQWRIDAFELWYWKRLLRVPWTARRSNQSILKEMSPKYLLEGLILNLKPKCHNTRPGDTKNWLFRKRPWCWVRLKAWGEGDNREWGVWTALPTQWTWDWASSGSWWWTGKPGMLQSIELERVRRDSATELNWKSRSP